MTTRLEDTGERMIPEFHKGNLIYAEHYTRYIRAADMVAKKVVLDIACGSGYGTSVLAKTATKVYGVDIDSKTVAYAQENFAAKNIEYRVGDGERIPLPDKSVDVAVSFETIEHIPNYHQFIIEVKRILKPGGILILSTPNDVEFAEGNQFHAHEFEHDELANLLRQEFAYIQEYYQATWKYVAIGKAELFSREGLTQLPTLNLAPLRHDQYLYFYFICSNQKLKAEIQPLAAAGAHYSDRKVLLEQQRLQQEIMVRQEVIDAHVKQIADLKDLVATTKKQLNGILSSRSFKVASKAAQLKNKLKP